MRRCGEFSEFKKTSPDEIINDFKQDLASNLEARQERWGYNLEYFVHYLNGDATNIIGVFIIFSAKPSFCSLSIMR
jgi:hypothetical protein